MEAIMTSADVLDRLVPITSFNKGLASKVFDRARNLGPLFVLKNNVPEAVILSPEDFARMSEAEENYALLLEAMERIEANSGKPGTPLADVMADFGITDDDVESVGDVELA
jgi:PHD/YefM family antitoxin component YafN of YafNO toxin-antitoxin module